MTPAGNAGPSTAVGIDLDLDPGDPAAAARRRARHRAPVATLAALGSGGALGALGRYALALAVPTGAGRFPWATLLVNVSGSAALGAVLVVLAERLPRRRLARALIGTGFIGAYTTFSTFMVEALLLARDGHPTTAALYLIASTAAGLAAVWLGMTGARLALGSRR